MTTLSDYQFCQEAALKANEPLMGTAPTSPNVVLISWPKKCWGRKVFDSKRLPEDLKSAFETYQERYPKSVLRLIQQPGMSDDSASVFFFPEALHYQNVPIDELGSLLKHHAAGTSPRQSSCSVSNETHLFICTHGKRDACCAKFGNATFDACTKVIEENQLPIQLWETSHLGGHRFASTAIAYPSGDTYGWIAPKDVLPWLQSLVQKSIYSPLYRGRAGMPQIEQTALAAVHQHYFRQQQQGTATLLRQEPSEEGTCQVHVQWQSVASEPQSHRVWLKQQTFVGPVSCGDEEPFKTRTRWILEEVL